MSHLVTLLVLGLLASAASDCTVQDGRESPWVQAVHLPGVGQDERGQSSRRRQCEGEDLQRAQGAGKRGDPPKSKNRSWKSFISSMVDFVLCCGQTYEFRAEFRPELRSWNYSHWSTVWVSTKTEKTVTFRPIRTISGLNSGLNSAMKSSVWPQH